MADDKDAQRPELEPEDFLSALLRITPKDAQKIRGDSPATRPRKPAEGARHDYGEG